MNDIPITGFTASNRIDLFFFFKFFLKKKKEKGEGKKKRRQCISASLGLTRFPIICKTAHWATKTVTLWLG
jgi:hypothetical protein